MNEHTIRLHIEGMSCQNCVRHAHEALASVPGVTSAEVTLEDKSAVVIHDGTTAVAALIAAIDEEGYVASPAD